MFMLFSIHIQKNQAHEMLGTTKSNTTLWLVLLFPRQLKYNIVVLLLQVKIAKGGQSLYIFRAYITTKDGQKIYAKDRGKRAFRFWVGPGQEPKKKNKN